MHNNYADIDVQTSGKRHKSQINLLQLLGKRTRENRLDGNTMILAYWKKRLRKTLTRIDINSLVICVMVADENDNIIACHPSSALVENYTQKILPYINFATSVHIIPLNEFKMQIRTSSVVDFRKFIALTLDETPQKYAWLLLHEVITSQYDRDSDLQKELESILLKKIFNFGSNRGR